MFNVIACHKLLKLHGACWGFHAWRSVSSGFYHFIASLILELVDFEVVIYGAEVISVFPVEDIASDCFPWTVWNFVRDKWFLLLIFLVSSHTLLCSPEGQHSGQADKLFHAHVEGSLQLLCGHHGVARVSWASG